VTRGLEITKSVNQLDWFPEMTLEKTIFTHVDFYKRQNAGENERGICMAQIGDFFS